MKAEHLNKDNLSKLDASLIMKSFLDKLGKTYPDYVSQYVDKCLETEEASNILPSGILNALKSHIKIEESDETTAH